MWINFARISLLIVEGFASENVAFKNGLYFQNETGELTKVLLSVSPRSSQTYMYLATADLIPLKDFGKSL
jgi:hypothetical protein